MFVASLLGQPHLHVVFEMWGLSCADFRVQQGYGRHDAQPTGHVRQVLLHIGRALHHLHHSLGLVHTGVSLASIIVRAIPSSLSGRIACQLGGLTSLEEASSFLNSLRGISVLTVATPRPTVFYVARPVRREKR